MRVLLILSLFVSAFAVQSSSAASDIKVYRTKIFYFQGRQLGQDMRTPMHVAHIFCRDKGFVGANRANTTDFGNRVEAKIYLTRIECAKTKRAMSNLALRSYDRVDNNLPRIAKRNHATRARR